MTKKEKTAITVTAICIILIVASGILVYVKYNTPSTEKKDFEGMRVGDDISLVEAVLLEAGQYKLEKADIDMHETEEAFRNSFYYEDYLVDISEGTVIYKIDEYILYGCNGRMALFFDSENKLETAIFFMDEDEYGPDTVEEYTLAFESDYGKSAYFSPSGSLVRRYSTGHGQIRVEFFTVEHRCCIVFTNNSQDAFIHDGEMCIWRDQIWKEKDKE